MAAQAQNVLNVDRAQNVLDTEPPDSANRVRNSWRGACILTSGTPLQALRYARVYYSGMLRGWFQHIFKFQWLFTKRLRPGDEEPDYAFFQFLYLVVVPAFVAIFSIILASIVAVTDVIGLRRTLYRILAAGCDGPGRGFSVANAGCVVHEVPWVGSLAANASPADTAARDAVAKDIVAATSVLWTPNDPNAFRSDTPVSRLLTRLCAVPYEVHGDEPQEVRDAKMELWGFGAAGLRLDFGYSNANDPVTFASIVWALKPGGRDRPFINVSFQGTSPFSLGMLLTDAGVTPVPVDDGSSKVPELVHEGFRNSLFDRQRRQFDQLMAAILEVRRKFGVKEPFLWVSGHSLGAAMAALFLYGLMRRSTVVGDAQDGAPRRFHLEGDETATFKGVGGFTVGQPRVGNSAFRASFKELLAQYGTTLWRVRHANDIVTKIPPAGLYQHVGTRVHWRYAPGSNALRDAKTWAAETARSAFTAFSKVVNAVLSLRLKDAVLYVAWWVTAEAALLFFINDHLTPEYMAHVGRN